VEDHLVVWEEGASDMNSTCGMLERNDAADAAWVIEGCD
jgi:hypothetical protein